MRTDYGSASIRSQLLGLALRNTARRVIDAWTLAPGLPWPYGVVDHAGRMQRKVPGTVTETVRIGACRAQVVRTPGSRSGRHVLYLHGGAFLVGGWHLHGSLMSRIADATGSTLHAIEYRQMPKHAVHTATADGLAAYRHLLAQGIPPQDITFMGDSAGGYLCFTVADLAREQGLPAPRSIVAMSPLIDFDLVRTPIQAGRGCSVFGSRAVERFAQLATRLAADAGLHGPTDCSLAGLPPVHLQVSAAESLYPQVCAFAEQLEAAGVPVELHVWPGQAHVFHAARLIPESHAAIRVLARFVERVAGPVAVPGSRLSA